jgi:alpha-beta hydrolase superfamily lysophospholipase
LIDELLRDGFHCVRTTLYGIDDSRRLDPASVADAWIQSIADAYRGIPQAFPGLPVSCLAFSVGALVAIRFLDTQEDVGFHRMVLLAPPVALTRLARLVRLLVPLWRLGLVLPSAAPREVRQRWATPLSEYGALLESFDAVQSLTEPEKIGQIPTFVTVDVGDELVSYDGIEPWVVRNGLSSWLVEPLRDRRSERHTYRHLIVTRAALGDDAWTNLTSTICAHLSA